MPAASALPPFFLDVPTLTFVAVCLAALLGLFLIFTWLQQRDARALAWWGSAYLIGAAAMTLWTAQTPFVRVPPEVPGALFFVACGVIWNGVRLFHGRRLLPLPAAAGALTWLALFRFPTLMEAGGGRVGLGALMVGCYTFVIAWELWRERRKSLFSRTAAIIVPGLHAAIFLMPFIMQAALPKASGPDWPTVLALETIIYAVGTAFIVLLMVSDHHVRVYRTAASTDHLTGLLNRRAFLEGARTLCEKHGPRGPVTLMMFDLDHFKSINDRFGHAVGDEALRVFAQVANTSLRASDVVGRMGGEEFAAIVPGGADVARIVAERLRAGFEKAGATIAGHAMGATVSIGAAGARGAVIDLDALIQRADEALYRAKHNGRNRLELVLEEALSAGALGADAPVRPAQRGKSTRGATAAAPAHGY